MAATDSILTTDYQSYYRPGNFKFNLTIGDKVIGVNKVSGLGNSTDVIEYREGGEVELNHKFPGLTKVDNITVERAIVPGGVSKANPTFFLDWEKSVLDVTRAGGGAESNKEYRKLIRVDLLDRTNSIVSVWYCYNCWPTKVSWSDFDAGGNDVQRETVELACEYVRRLYT